MRFATWLLIIGLLGGSLAAQAADKKVPATSVAIVDVQRILQESSAASNVKKQIELQSSRFQAKISKEERSLRLKEKKLATLRETAEADEYAKAEQKLRERFLFVERHVQARRKILDQAYNKAMKQVRASLIEIVKKSAKARGVNLVVVKQQVIWNDQVIDITDIVLEQLNKQLPDIEINIADQDADIFAGT